MIRALSLLHEAYIYTISARSASSMATRYRQASVGTTPLAQISRERPDHASNIYLGRSERLSILRTELSTAFHTVACQDISAQSLRMDVRRRVELSKLCSGHNYSARLSMQRQYIVVLRRQLRRRNGKGATFLHAHAPLTHRSRSNDISTLSEDGASFFHSRLLEYLVF